MTKKKKVIKLRKKKVKLIIYSLTHHQLSVFDFFVTKNYFILA